MIVLGIILIILGLVVKSLSILVTIGIILLIVGVVLSHGSGTARIVVGVGLRVRALRMRP